MKPEFSEVQAKYPEAHVYLWMACGTYWVFTDKTRTKYLACATSKQGAISLAIWNVHKGAEFPSPFI